MAFLEDAIGSPSKELGIAFVRHRKPAHRHAIHLLEPRRQLIAPRDVVGRARREDLDVTVPREMLRHIPRVQLGATVDRVAVPLYDNRDLHCPSSESPSGPAADAWSA